MRIEGSSNIEEIFSIFHDGVITHYIFNDGKLTLEIEIQYLAERISPDFTQFHVLLENISNIRFTTWPSDLQSESELITEPNIIFAPDLDILESNSKESHVQVICNQASSDYEYCGGELYFLATSAIVTDENGKEYSLDELDVLCKGYWDEWASKK
jgi:hypothetical protein